MRTDDCVARYRTEPEHAVRELTDRLQRGAAPADHRGRRPSDAQAAPRGGDAVARARSRVDRGGDGARRGHPATGPGTSRAAAARARTSGGPSPARRGVQQGPRAGRGLRRRDRRFVSGGRRVPLGGARGILAAPRSAARVPRDAAPRECRTGSRGAWCERSADRTRRKPPTRSSPGVLFYPVCWTVEAWAAWALGGGWALAGLLVTLLPTAFFALGWQERSRKVARETRAFLRFLVDRDLHRRLVARRGRWSRRSRRSCPWSRHRRLAGRAPS